MKTKLTKIQLEEMAEKMLKRANSTNNHLTWMEVGHYNFNNNEYIIRYFKLSQLLKIQLKAYNRLKNYAYNCK